MKRLFWAVLLCLPAAVVIAQPDYDAEAFSIVDTLITNANPGRLSPDGRTFICGIKGEDGSELLYQWQRRSLKKEWNGPELLEGTLNQELDIPLEKQQSTGSGVESGIYSNMQPTISEDGLRLVFVRNQGDRWDGNDLWLGTRESEKAPFDNVRRIDELCTDSTAESYPFISANGYRLYYITDDGIMVTQYNSVSGRFSAPRRLTLPWDKEFISCWLSEDELLFVGITYTNELFYAQRTEITSPFMEMKSLDLGLQGMFLSSPSFDPNGDLYLYGSISHEVDEPVLPDEGLKESESLMNEFEDYSWENLIIIMRPSRR